MATVSVQVKLYSILKQYGREKGWGDAFTLTVEEGTSLDQIRQQIGIPARQVGRFVRNGQGLPADYIVQAGDVIDIIPPTIGGG